MEKVAKIEAPYDTGIRKTSRGSNSLKRILTRTPPYEVTNEWSFPYTLCATKFYHSPKTHAPRCTPGKNVNLFSIPPLQVLQVLGRCQLPFAIWPMSAPGVGRYPLPKEPDILTVKMPVIFLLTGK